MSSNSKGGSGLGTSNKMCKSPKNSSGIYQKPDSTSSGSSTASPSYETLSTNCTVVGSNNLHLLKKQQQHQQQQQVIQQIQIQSPVYSNASPVGGMVFPPPTSPYTSGGGGTISPAPAHKISSPGIAVKSPQPTQAQVLTPQQNYSVMQIIHNPLIGQRIQTTQQPSQQNIIKLKPHLNILPKPASIQQVPRSSVSPHQQLLTIPTVTPTTLSPINHSQQHHAQQLLSQQSQQPIIINQMPTHAMLTAAGQLQFILRPTTNATAHAQPTVHSGKQQHLGQLSQQQLNSLIQLQQLQQQQQQQLATLQLPPPPPPPALVGGGQRSAHAQQVIQQVQLQAAAAGQQGGQQMVRVMTNGLTSGGVMQGIMQQQGQTGTTYVTTQNHIHPPVNISPKKKPKKKKQKLDLANIMKLSGIGDDDDVQFESDTSQSESEPNSHSQSSTPQPQISIVQSQPTVVNTATSEAAAAAAVQAAAAFQQQQQQMVQNQLLQPATLATLLQSLQQQQQAQQVQAAHKQQLGNIQIPTVQATAPNIVQVLSNQSFTTTPSGLVTPTNTPHILSIPTSTTLTHQAQPQHHHHHSTATAAFAPFNLSAATNAAAASSGGANASGTATGQAGFTLNGATAATLQRAAAAGSTTALPVPVTGLGGFKLALGEDGRLVLQHDPSLQQQQQQQQQQQDLQSQLLLQTIFGLSGGGLLLQPTTIDQQVHSQTVQTIQQQQTVQTIQQQTVQSQTVQHHSLQTIQQTIQPQIQAQTVQQTIHHHHHHQVQQPVNTPTAQAQPQTQQLQPQTIQQLIQQQQQAQAQVVNSISVSPAPAPTPAPSPVHQHAHAQHQHHQQQQVVNSIAPLPQPISNSVTGGHGHNHHHQPVLKVQPFQKSQPPINQHPAPTPTPTAQQQQQQGPPPTSYVVNLTPDQLEQLKRNGQLTVNGQTIFMQRAAQVNTSTTQTTTTTASGSTSTTTGFNSDHKLIGHQNANVGQMGGPGGGQQHHLIAGQVKVTPKAIKRKSGGNKILGNKDLPTTITHNSGVQHTIITAHQTATLHNQQPPPVAPAKVGITGNSNIDKVINTVVREAAKSAGINAVVAASAVQKITAVNQLKKQVRPIIPSTKTTVVTTAKIQQQILPTASQIKPQTPQQIAKDPSNNQEVVDRLLGQIIEESQQQKIAIPSAKSITTTKAPTTTSIAASSAVAGGGSTVSTKSVCQQQQQQQAGQRVHTIQLTPQQQQYLKSVQLQIQTLSARLPQANGDVELQNALKVLFHEQQKILASGKLLPPDKVFYHNNQIIVNTGSSSGPTVLNTSGLTVLQPPPGKGLEAFGLVGHQQQQQQQQTTAQQQVTKADVGTSTSTNGCGGGIKAITASSNHLQPQSSAVCSTTATINHHPVNNNITKTLQTSQIQQASSTTLLNQSSSQTLPDSSTSTSNIVPPTAKLPSLPSLHPLQQQTTQQQTIVVQLNSANRSSISTPSNTNQLDSAKVPRPILPRLPLQQPGKQQQQQQNSDSSTILVPAQIQSTSVNNNQQNALLPQPNLLLQHHQQQQQQKIAPILVQQVIQQPIPPPLTAYVKTQRIEQQLSSDQSGAVNPDIQTSFRDKSDACKRLLRYHCYDQPVLSEKDLTKADEIFELTARHFIDKFGRMVDKYRYLLLKEGQRHVQTSELMMLDRMFLAEEQQSLLKLRQDIEQGNFDSLQPNQQQNQPEPRPNIIEQQDLVDLDADKDESNIIDNEDSVVGSINDISDDEDDDDDFEEIEREDKDDEEYDEWQCIQRELGCLTASATPLTMSDSNNRFDCQNTPSTTNSNNAKLLRTNTNSNSSNYSNSSSASSSSCFSSSSSFGKRLSNNIDNNDSIKRYKAARKHEYAHSAANNQQSANYTGQFNSLTNPMTYTNSVANSTTNNTEEMDNSGSIDEQVQSAIDSILNLQQTSGIATALGKNDAADRLGLS